jgi:plasmid stabilization system protein ParE
MRVQISPSAYQDLKDIRRYISETLFNPIAAERTARNIIKSYSKLKYSPYMGTSLRSKVDFETPIRFIVSGNYLAFYVVNEKDDFVEIVRIIYGKRDYTKIIFPDYGDAPGGAGEETE